MRDLRVYAEPLEAEVVHYRDSGGHEADAIVQAADGRWAAFDVKPGGEKLIDEGAESLLRFVDQLDTRVCDEPVTLAVIVSHGYGYKRPDGIKVIPIDAFGP